MTSCASQKKNDCVIVAIVNATGKPYEEVAKNFTIGKHGIDGYSTAKYLESLGYVKRTSIPRRGQGRITGIVRVISTKYATGHLVYMKNGIVFDSFHTEGLPIKEYQQRTSKCHINRIWVKTNVLIDTVDTTVSLDFLATLDD